jgi:PAS domain S-box-containing protein
MAHRDPSSPTPMPTILRYGIAFLSVAIAIGLDFFLLRQFEAILTPFLFAVAATVWYAGTWPSVLAIALSVLSLNYFFLRPGFSFSPTSSADLVYLAFCIFCALAVGWVNAVRRRAEQELRQARDELEAKVVERTANLQRSESYLAETQKLTHTGSWAWDARSQRVLYCSEEMFRIYGLDPQMDLPTRKNFRQRVHPEDRNRTDERFARVVNEKVDSFDEYRVLLPDGTVKHVISSGHPVLDGNGEFIAFIGTATDVTERKRAEEALRESEAKIRRLVDSNIIGIFVWDFDGRILEANDEFLRMVSYDREDLVSGRIRWTELTPPDWRERDNAKIEQQKISGRLEPFEKEYTRKDGRRVPVLIGVATFEEGGNEGVAFVLDLTERKRAEEALRESEYKLRQIIETVPGLLWSLAPDGEPTHFNQRFLDYFDKPFENFKHGGWLALIHPDDVPETERIFSHAIQTGTSYRGVLRFRRADGEYRWHEARGEPLRDRQGNVIQWYGLSVDIDEAKKAEQALREREAQLAEARRELRQMIDTIPIPVASYSADARRDFVNAAWKNYTGVSDEAARGSEWSVVAHPEDTAGVNKMWRDALATGEPWHTEERVRRADGQYRWFAIDRVAARDDNGKIIKWYGTAYDIEDRKRAEDALRESEYKLRQIIDTVPGFLWSGDPAGEPTQINQHMSNYSGMRFEDFKHGGWEAFVHPADYPETAKAFYRAIQTGTPYQDVIRLRRADGEFRWYHVRGEPLRDRQGRIIQWYGLSVDIDEAKENEDRLRRSEAYLAEAQRLSHCGVTAFKGATVFYGSEEIYRIWGFDPAQGVPSRKAVLQRIHPDDRDRLNAEVERALGEKRSYSTAYRIVLPDGTVKHLESIGQPVFSTNGELVEVVATQIDVTERKRAEEALRGSEAKFRDYAESASDWYWETDPDHKFTRLTEDERRLARGLPTVSRIGVARWEFATDVQSEPEKWELHLSMLKARQPFRDFVYPATHSDGSVVYNKISGKPVFDAKGEFRGYRGTGTDVTALRTAEEEARENEQRYRKAELELAHANRVATMGQLTASITHEVNQPITAAVTYALAARRFLSAEPPNFREVDNALSLIVKEGNRAGEVVGRVRALIKKAPVRKDAVEINDALLEVIALTRTEAVNNSVSVRTQLAEGLPRVQGDRVQLQQVLLNLIINAIEAMRDGGEGQRELLVSSCNGPDGVSVEVRDSGPGFAAADLDRVFEAFYSTKPNGVGLGLSICRSIVEAHNGRLWASPNVPRGAIFGFITPAHPAAAS